MTGLYERDQKAISRMSHLRFFPQAVTGGAGSWLIGDDGRRLLDLSASWGAASLGHSHPAIRSAVAAALDSQAGASVLSTANAPAVDLAERLLALAPRRAAGRVWLGHSGSDANETIARACLAATGRPRIISFKGAYHGGTAGSMAISGHTAQDGVEKAAGLSLVRYPDPYRGGGPERACEIALEELRTLFAGPVPAHEVAAFFIEPIQSDGGMIVPPPGFFREVETLCRRHGILLVADEVKVGLGRSGQLHCHQHDGIEPDIVVFGKGLGGGLPISAAVGPEEIMNHRTAFSFQTTHGNPACASAALAVLRTIETERLVENAAGVGEFLLDGLRALGHKHALIGDVRGRGLAIGVELVTDPSRRTPAKRETAMTVFRAFELGLVIYYVEMESNVLELTPPLTLTRDEAAQAVDLLDRALSDVGAGQVDIAAVAPFKGW